MADFDVAIVGGGPAGSTAASLLKTYRPDLSVLILERARFPREHVGESQLPPISAILHEMGCWDEVERAGFPIKIGASYTWGRDTGRWDFDFYPVESWRDEARPARYDGQRKFTAFQVDRARYDEILLNHAAHLGATVRQETSVRDVLREGDRVTGLKLDSGETVSARHYIDASGVIGLFRRSFGIGSETPQELRNIAIWDYWQNAEWAVEIGVGATRVQVRSLPFGWIWFIPLGPTRTSIGLVCPNDYHKRTGKSPAALYKEAVESQPDIAALIEKAEPEGKIQACKDWSHLADRIVGENWFICGEAAGFADPILAAGMTLAHTAARDAAYSIMEIERGEIERDWLTERYNERNRENIRQHIRFAQYWYAANGRFTDLQDHCQAIAAEAGLTLEPEKAWQWLAQGGFTHEQVGVATLGSFDLASIKHVMKRFDAEGRPVGLAIDGKNTFSLNLEGATLGAIGQLKDGRIHQIRCWERDARRLAVTGYFGSLIEALKKTDDGNLIIRSYRQKIADTVPAASQHHVLHAFLQALEVMVEEGWVVATCTPSKPVFRAAVNRSLFMRDAAEADAALEKRRAASP
ncbi:MAG: NAD(P)/FAD-dependent oxidoreductase [Pseudomonadota bacterium]